MIKLISQILAFIAFTSYLFSIQFKEKKKILGIQFISNVFYTISYYLLNAYSAVMVDLISTIRALSYYHYERKNSPIPRLLMLILVILSCLVGFFIVENPFDILPIIISIIYIVTSWYSNIRYLQIGYIIAALLWIIYNLHIGTYIPLIGNFFEIISGVIAILRMKREVK